MTKLVISAKCSDLFWCAAYDDDDKLMAEHTGYVPDFMPSQHWGDYVCLDIDVETGMILNWKANEAKRAIKNGLKSE